MHYGATNSNTKYSSHDKDCTRIQPSQGAQEATLLQEQRNNNACTAVMEPKKKQKIGMECPSSECVSELENGCAQMTRISVFEFYRK
jgi:hypothetical protein